MTPTEVKAIIQEQLPILMDDPLVRDFVLKTVSNHYAPKKETESNFERMMSKIDDTLAEIRRNNEEHNRKMEEFNKEQAQKWEESNKKWEEFNKEQAEKWEESNKKWEESNKKWEESNKKWEESNKKWEENSKQWEENSKQWEENKKSWDEQHKTNREILFELKIMHQKHDSTIGALGARWGLHSEASFRNALKGILEDSFGVQVLNISDFDDEGEVFGRPDQIELDIIIKNGLLMVCEIKSSMSKSDMYTFDRKVSFYQKHHNRIVNRKIVISPMVDEKAKKISKELGIEVFSYAGDVTI
jgi:hypothetical protein